MTENTESIDTAVLTPEVQAKIAAIKEAVALKENPIEEVAAPAVSDLTAPQKSPITGADVDWKEYNLNSNLAHLYPRAQLVETQNGPQWAYVATEFYSVELNIGAYGKLDSKGVPVNLGEFLTQRLLSSEGWKISGIIPSTLGRVALLLERQKPLILPMPELLKVKTELPPVTEDELNYNEEAAATWTEGLTSPPQADSVDVAGAVEGAL